MEVAKPVVKLLEHNESQWGARECCGGAWGNMQELPREPAPQASTYILLLVFPPGIKLALGCIVYDISKY